MRLVSREDRYLAITVYAEREVPKAAGFRWDPAARCWWTSDSTVAEKLAQYADDACADALAQAKAQQEAAVAASRAATTDVQVPAPKGLAYMPFQRAGIAYAMARPNVLIADEMGLGKTIQAIGVVNANPSIRQVLVVCPASIKINWQRELQRWLTRPLSVGIAVGSDLPQTDVVIVNYDLLARHKAALAARAWDLLVLDEAHYVKNPKAQRSQQVYALRARRRLALTGTPVLNRPVELWPLAHMLAPDVFPSFWAFVKRYCAAKQLPYGWYLGGASNLAELQEKLRASCMVRRLKADVLQELPPKLRQVLEINSIDAPTRKLVEEEDAAWKAQEARLVKLRAAVDRSKASPKKAAYKQAVAALRDGVRAAFATMSDLRHRAALAKVPYVVEHLRDVLESAEKVVVFAHHHDVIGQLKAAFPDSVVLTGETAMADRQEAVDKFQTDPGVRLFFGSITAAGLGITLTAASHVVFAELDWVPANVTQAEDRLHRIGQHDSVLVQHVVLDRSIDARIARALVSKQDVIDQALDAADAAEPVLA